MMYCCPQNHLLCFTFTFLFFLYFPLTIGCCKLIARKQNFLASWKEKYPVGFSDRYFHLTGRNVTCFVQRRDQRWLRLIQKKLIPTRY
ncbi:Uncharacterized protein TCM_015792 [Theobroma cacao]|uniref:Uncharacterized protein n=1 Tax=Theobroma cacao TaxID=3641 RepID=A0A061GAM6_THECC|nr:Uncharacterized protein TCM_015792 [Theobroma cacao]